MTPFDESVNILHVTFNAVLLWAIWHGPWRRSCQERYRQSLFELRDELFAFARQGSIAFTNPAYVALRSHINSMIRFSHLISLTRLATFIVMQRYIGEIPQVEPSLTVALAEVKGKETKQALMAICDKARSHTARHLLFVSPHVLIAGPALLFLDRVISKKSRSTSLPAQQRHPVAGKLIEGQARDAFRSEATKLKHDAELGSAT